jgi:uncharacterized membrane protein
MALVIRQIYRPAEDLVRMSSGVDDPSGGVFENAPDNFPSWWPQRLRPAQQILEVPDASRDHTVPA